MAITVTFTGTGGFAGTGGTNAVPKLRVLIFTNQAGSFAGGTGDRANTQYSVPITVAATGSFIVGSMVAPNSVSYTALANSTILDNISDATNNQRHGSFISSSTTGSTGSQTFGASNTWSTDGLTVGLEIKGTSLTRQSGSEPAVVSTTTVSAVTTASFTPPAGSVVVALVDGLCTGGSVTDSSSMTWTQQVADGSDGYAAIFTAVVPSSGVTVNLTTPNLALAAPLVTPITPITVNLTAPNLALGAPLLSPSVPITVNLTTPNLALGAPLVTPQVSSNITVNLTTPNLVLGAPLLAPNAGRELILSMAPTAGVDRYGNAYPEGLSVGALGMQQVQILIDGLEGFVSFPSGASFEQTFAQLAAGVGGTSPAQFIQLVLAGAACTTTGAHDQVIVVLNSAAADNSSFANMEFFYKGSNGVDHEYAFMDATGFNIVAGSIVATHPGTTPATAETWSTISLQNSYTAGSNNGFTDVPQVRLMADNKTLQFKGTLVTPASPSSTVWGQMPTGYPNANLGGPFGMGLVANLAGGQVDHVQLHNNGNLTLNNTHSSVTFDISCIVPTQ